MLTATYQRRLLSTNSTTSAQTLTAKRWTEAGLLVALPAWESMIVPMGQMDGNRKRYAEISFCGVGSDNDTGSCYVWQVKRGIIDGANKHNDVELIYLGLAAFTLSTLVGAGASTTVKSTERIADTLTWTPATTSTTPKGAGTIIETAFGGAAASVYSPADNTPARLFLPEVGNGDILLELITGGSATSVNAVVETGL